ncbi:DUF3301 domain-containing protein [Alteromonas sp. CYL-A6]|uniref:DUF3301 domain-containing protein n=1 Tax=Alteromonas nitratireducens TaxID=3390813 RepID=UPI0034C09144
MTLGELVTWLLVGFIAFQFWRIRSISEAIEKYLAEYCASHQLQLLSVARKQTRLSFKTGKPQWHSLYLFEFSSTGEDRYQGELECIGMRIIRTHVPVHKIH